MADPISLTRLGRDIFINHIDDNDVRISPQNDFRVVTYRDNLRQAILSRLKTNRGELTLHPEYGSRLSLLIGQVPNQFVLGLARQHVREALLQEPRIQSIDSIKARFTDTLMTTMSIEIIVTPIESEQPLNIVFPFILTGETA